MKTPIVILAALAATAAFAQQPTTPPSGQAEKPPSFETLDKNSDGRVTVSEAKADAKLAANFAMIDKQGKGYISKAEYEKHVREQRS